MCIRVQKDHIDPVGQVNSSVNCGWAAGGEAWVEGWDGGIFYIYSSTDCGMIASLFVFFHRASCSECVDCEDGPVRSCLHETESDRQRLPRPAYPGYVQVTHGHNSVNVCV